MGFSSAPSVEAEYAEIIDFLCGMEKFGILLGLENITSLLNLLGNPQLTFPTIHVAGSNGKGSTSSFINSMLMAAGYKTALYTSPHLNDFRERIRLNGNLVPKEALLKSFKKLLPIYNSERTTFFEFTTAAAFDCIAEYNPDIAIIEVGLGGRLDATNTINPLVTVITDISREHEDYLGKGIANIAREKAGIIKPGVPLITGATRREAREVILTIARENHVPVKVFGKDYSGRRTGIDTFTYKSNEREFIDLKFSMPGSHQIKNAGAAIAVIESLSSKFNVSESAVREGIGSTSFPGRFELVSTKPDVIIDGAHTPEGMRLLKSTFVKLYKDRSPYLLLGMLGDKDYLQLIKIIAPMAKEIACVPPIGARALEPERQAQILREMGYQACSFPDIVSGFMHLRGKALENDVILCTGSLYMIGSVRTACGQADR